MTEEIARYSKAKDLTPQERQDWAEWAHQVQAKIVTAIAIGREQFWAMAEALYEFDQDGGHKALGYETLDEWLAQAEIGMKRATYYKSIQAWRELAVNLRVSTSRLYVLEPSKVEVVLPKVVAGEVLTEDALNDAEAMPVKDLRDKYYGPRPVKPKAEPAEPDSSYQPLDGTEGQTDAQDGTEAITAADVGKVPTPEPSANGQVAGEDVDQDEYIRSRTEALSRAVVSPSAEPDNVVDVGPTEVHDVAPAPGGVAVATETDRPAYGELMAENEMLGDAIAEFVKAFRAAPRSRHLPDLVDKLAAYIGL